jgi:hypothetical protein
MALAHRSMGEPGRPEPTNILRLADWGQGNGFDAVIWTALEPKFPDWKGLPSGEAVIAYLAGLDGTERDAAEEYIRRAPAQIATVYRRQIEDALGWFRCPCSSR